MNFPRAVSPIVAGVAAVWAAAIVYGMTMLLNYENTPGKLLPPRGEWPAGTSLKLDATLPTLLMFAHPRCPCTRASMAELARLMTQCQGRTRASVVFYKPPGADDDWAKTDLWRSASEIPGVDVHTDEGGAEAARFHAETSGTTLLYKPEGKLAFAGGITSSRGHEGDNAGRTSIVAILRLNPGIASRTAVFGCPLVDPSSLCKPSNQSFPP